MSDSGVTLGSIARLDPELIEGEVADYLKSLPTAKPFGPVFGFIAERIGQGVGEVLNADLIDMLIDAFATIRELRRYADPSTVPPPEEVSLHFVEQRASVEKQIDVDVAVDSLQFPAFKLTLQLSAVFKGVALYVTGGKVVGVGLGPAHVEVALRHGKKNVLKPLESRELTFKSRIELTPPLLITRAESVGQQDKINGVPIAMSTSGKVTVEFDGRTYAATYTVEGDMIHVKTHTEMRSVALSGKSAEDIARRELKEIVEASRRH